MLPEDVANIWLNRHLLIWNCYNPAAKAWQLLSIWRGKESYGVFTSIFTISVIAHFSTISGFQSSDRSSEAVDLKIEMSENQESRTEMLHLPMGDISAVVICSHGSF